MKISSAIKATKENTKTLMTLKKRVCGYTTLKLR